MGAKSDYEKEVHVDILMTSSPETADSLRSLSAWIAQDHNLPDPESPKDMSSTNEHLGLPLGDILSIVLGSAAVVQLAKAVHTWIIATRPMVSVRLKFSDREFEIKAQNFSQTESLIRACLNGEQENDEQENSSI